MHWWMWLIALGLAFMVGVMAGVVLCLEWLKGRGELSDSGDESE